MQPQNSRQRLLNAIQLQEADRTPCSFMSFTVMRKRQNDDWYAVARAEAEMGLDPMLFIPSLPRRQRLDHPDLRGLPVRFHPEVRCREWKEKGVMGAEVCFKEYTTPAGKLSTSIRLSEDWPHGNHIPFIDDYQVPRHLKALVKGPKTWKRCATCCSRRTRRTSQLISRKLNKPNHLFSRPRHLLAGGWGVGMDMANWLCGMQNLMAMRIEQPDFVDELLE